MDSRLKFRMWFKYGLKAQKLLAQSNGHKQHALKGQKLIAQGNGHKQHALKGQKLLAQGIALGVVAISKAPCKGKSFVNYLILKAFALTGRQVCVHKHPGRCPGLRASAPSGRAAYMGSMVQSYVLHSSSFRAYWVIPTVQLENFSTYSSCM